MGVRQDLHRRRHHRLGGDAEGRCQGLRGRSAGSRRLPDRPGSVTRRPSLAGDSSRRVLSRRPDQDRDLERHRHGALGHQGQDVRRAGLQPARRSDARSHPGVRQCQRGQRRERDESAAAWRATLAVQIQRRPEVRRGGGGTFRGAAQETGLPASISASSSTAPSSRPPPPC